MKNIIFVGPILLSFVINLAFSQSDYQPPDSTRSDTIPRLEKMVVTATRTARKASEIPVSVTIISKEDIAVSAAKNIDDLLQYAAGVQVKRPVGMGEGVPSDIITRGIPGALAASRTLILVDGIPTNVSGTPFLIVNEIPLEAVEKVEIVRGPFSSLYGANAFGGVINIITKVGDGDPGLEIAGETSLPFTIAHNYFAENREYYGKDFWRNNFGETYWNGTGVLSGGTEKYDYLFSGGYRNIGNYYMTDSARVRAGDVGYQKSIENHDYRDYRAFFKGGYRISEKLRTQLHLRYFKSELGFGLTGSTVPPADEVTKGEKFLVGPYVTYALSEKSRLRIGGFYRRVNGEYLNEVQESGIFVPSRWNSLTNDWQIEGQAITNIGEYNTIIAGFDQLWNNINFGAMINRVTKDTIPPFFAREETISNLGLYLQDEISIWNDLKLVPAFRYDLHSEFGFTLRTFSPKLGISANVPGMLSLRASSGGAFRAPSTAELYMPDLPINQFTLRSNSTLKPEYVWAWDVGADIEVVRGLVFKTDLFLNYMTDLIAFKFTSDILTEKRVTHGNLDKATSWGFENQVEWTTLEYLLVKGNYTFTRSQNSTYNVPLDYVPDHKANLEIDFRKQLGKGLFQVGIKEGFVSRRGYFDWATEPDTIKLTQSGIYVRPHYTSLSSYWVTDLTLAYSFPKEHRVSLTVQNLFDARYEQSGGTWAPGRFASIKYSVSLGRH